MTNPCQRRRRRRWRRKRRKAHLHHQHNTLASRQDVLLTATSFHSISTHAAPPRCARSAGTGNATKHTHTHSDIQAYTGLPLALQSFLFMPKITDLMALSLPRWLNTKPAPHRNTDQLPHSSSDFERSGPLQTRGSDQ